jgi:hypothetical protein
MSTIFCITVVMAITAGTAAIADIINYFMW